jgi:hypothetical protein
MAPRSKVDADGMKPCTKCGCTLSVSSFYTTGKKVDGSPKFNSWCKPCVKSKMASYHKETYGPDALSHSAERRTRSVKSYMQYLLAKARKRNQCDIAIDDLLRLWSEQDGKCAMTKWPMTMTLGRGRCETNASIDRIDSKKGYVIGNVQLVCRCVNVAKSDMSVDFFMALCSAVARGDYGIQNSSLAA